MEPGLVCEELKAYGRASDLRARTLRFRVDAVHLYRAMDRGERAARRLADQFLRAATSVGANVAEAQGAESRNDLRHKYAIALKEARETLYWLRLFDAADLLSSEQTAHLFREADELVAILTTITRRLRQPPLPPQHESR